MANMHFGSACHGRGVCHAVAFHAAFRAFWEQFLGPLILV